MEDTVEKKSRVGEKMDHKRKLWSGEKLGLHPLLRGAGAFLIGACAQDFCPWVRPLDIGLYGLLSGGINIVLAPLWIKTDRHLTEPSYRVLAYWAANALPWAISHGILYRANIKIPVQLAIGVPVLHTAVGKLWKCGLGHEYLLKPI